MKSFYLSGEKLNFLILLTLETGYSEKRVNWITSIDILSQNISNNESLPNKKTYERGIRYWNQNWILGYSDYPDSGIQIFDENLTLVEQIETESYGFDMLNAILIYGLEGTDVVYNIDT